MSTLISRLYNWVTDKGNSVKITASRMDGENDQIITALNRKVLCSGSAPSSPIAGQTWVDTTNKLLKYYRNNEWVIIGALHVGTSAMSTIQEGDLWYDTTNNLLKAYNGSTWDSMAIGTTPSAATQAEMESASSTSVYATPGRVKYHPGVAKAWGVFDGTGGSITMAASYNMDSSVTDNGTGDYTVAITTDMSGSDFAVSVHAKRSGSNDGVGIVNAVTAGTIRIVCSQIDSASSLIDASRVDVIAFGDQS